MANKVEVPSWVQENFPDWKKNLIGGGRAFFAGFVSVVSVSFVNFDASNLTSVDFWLNNVLVGALAGGIVYLGKWLRDKFYDSEVAQKIPF